MSENIRVGKKKYVIKENREISENIREPDILFELNRWGSTKLIG